MEQLIDRINKLALPLKIGIVAGLVILITAAFFFFLDQPLTEQITSLKAQQEAADKTLAEKQTFADNLMDKRKEMDALEQRLEEALTQLPEHKDLEELIAQLNDVGKKAGLEISKVTPGTENTKGFIAEIPLNISVTGNYHEIASFLQEIAGLRRIVNVSDLKLASPKINNDKVILNSEFLATTFRFSENKTPKKAGP
jgi:type IV pilus assembly protein PilO